MVLTVTSDSGAANDFLSFTYGIVHIFITSWYNFGNKKQQQQNPIKVIFKRGEKQLGAIIYNSPEQGVGESRTKEANISGALF